MKPALFALVLVALPGCAQLNPKDVLTDLSHCTRHYSGSIAMNGVAISDNATMAIQIDCAPLPAGSTP